MSLTYEQEMEKLDARFKDDTAGHELKVIKDDGLYRHLRGGQPGTVVYSFHVLTWPGYLCICGDMGTFVFARIEDMFKFFESDHGRINPQYWSEKLQAGEAEDYDWETVRDSVRSWLDSACVGLDDDEAKDLREEVNRQVLDRYAGSDVEAVSLISEFEHEGMRIETYDLRFKSYTFRFLWCCKAIVWAIAGYREEQSNGVA